MWWASPVNLSQGCLFSQPRPTVVVTTDASSEGWGGHSRTSSQTLALFHNLWNQEEKQLHINVLELRAVWLTLMTLSSFLRGKVVKVESDNSTTVAYINHQGGVGSWSQNQEMQLLFDWTILHQVMLSAVHRAGIDNVLMDYLS